MRTFLASAFALVVLAAPASAAPAALGGVATIALPPRARLVPADPGAFAARRERRGGEALLFAGAIHWRMPGAQPVQYEFFRTAHVAAPAPGSLAPDAALAALVAAAGEEPTWRPLRWRVLPQWSQDAAQLRWAYDVRNTRTEAMRTLGFAAQLTREGVLVFSHASLDPARFAADDARFRELLAGLRLRPERGWLDLRAGEPAAAYDAAALIAARGAPAIAAAEPPRSEPDAMLRRWRGRLERLEREDLLRLLTKVRWEIVVALLLGLRALWSFVRRRIVDPEEIRMPPGSERIGSAEPIEPESGRRTR